MKRSFYYLILTILALIFFNVVLSGRSIFIERDLSVFFIPPKILWVNLLKHGIFPFWNPYQYNGIPLLAALQPGVLYPPHILYFLLPFNLAWNWLIILHFLLSGITVFLFLQYLKSSDAGSFIGAVIFMLSGYLLSVHNLLPHLCAVSWFPLVLLFFLKSFETKRAREVVLAAVFLTLQFLSGAPEILMMTLLALVVISIFINAFSEEKVPAYSRVKVLFMLLFLFLLLSAVQLLPFYELSSLSIRRGGLSYREASIWSLAWRDFIQFFIPDPFGNFINDRNYWVNQSWLKTIYLGIMPFFLSAFYFAARDKRRPIFLILIGMSLIFALGGNTPVYKLLYHIPPFNSVRYPVKFLFLLVFVIAVTSGLGFDRMRRGVEEGDKRTKTIIVAGFYLGFMFALLWGYTTLFRADVIKFLEVRGFKPDAYNLTESNVHDVRRFAFFSFLFCLMLLVYLRVRYKKAVLFAIVTLLTADLFLANYGYFSTIEWKTYMEKHPFSSFLPAEPDTGRYFVTPKTHNRFDRYPASKRIMDSPFAAIFGFYTVEGAEVLRLNYYERFITMIKGAASPRDAERFFDMCGVRYLTTYIKVDEPEFRLLTDVGVGDDVVYLYEYRNYPGRFRLVSQVFYTKDENSMVTRLLDKGLDPKRQVVVLSAAAGYEEYGDAKGRVTLERYEPNAVSLGVDTDHDAFLYVSDTYYPGWKAYIDGRETRIFRANLVFRAIKVPKGHHEVSFRYVPLSFYLGLLLTALGLCLSLLLVIRRR